MTERKDFQMPSPEELISTEKSKEFLEKWEFVLEPDYDVTDLTPEERMAECIILESQEKWIEQNKG